VTPIDGPPIDIDDFRASMRAAGIEEIVGPMLALFAQEAPKGMATLTATVEAGDVDGIRRAAHALKSSAGNIRAKELADLLQALEAAAQAGSLPEALALFDRVKTAHRTAMDFLATEGHAP
jgi:HPt (histidine-containing phosphotransfer) domain-containing protein